jgi:predicted ABC-type ATPase
MLHDVTATALDCLIEAEMMAVMPRAYIIAGPNGAGKTTFARSFLPEDAACTTFINADLIAAGLSPFRPEAAELHAMRLMVEAMRECVAARRDFAIETTLSGRSYLSLIRSWKVAGYSVKVIFLKLQSVEEAIARVRYRVKLGGHHVPEEVVRRRFCQGWSNFEAAYRPLVDAWVVYDSSGAIPERISEGFNS